MALDGGQTLRSIPVMTVKECSLHGETVLNYNWADYDGSHALTKYADGLTEKYYDRDSKTGVGIWLYDYDGDGTWDTKITCRGGIRDTRTVKHYNNLYKKYTSVWQQEALSSYEKQMKARKK